MGATARLNEARELIAEVRAAEVPLVPLPFRQAVMRGYVYVACYGALEYAVTQGTQSFIGNMKAMGVMNAHLELPLNSVSLHAQLMSLETSSVKRRWLVRRELFGNLDETIACEAPDTAFGALLHNIWPETIAEIFQCFAIDKQPTADHREAGYLRELVERRNAVAHGREAASQVGEGKTADDLERMLNAVYSVCVHFLTALEEQAAMKLFIRPTFRANY